jgi:hypothetical protein
MKTNASQRTIVQRHKNNSGASTTLQHFSSRIKSVNSRIHSDRTPKATGWFSNIGIASFPPPLPQQSLHWLLCVPCAPILPHQAVFASASYPAVRANTPAPAVFAFVSFSAMRTNTAAHTVLESAYFSTLYTQTICHKSTLDDACVVAGAAGGTRVKCSVQR